ISRGAYEVGVCSEVSHRTVVSDPSATVGPESDVERTIERLLVLRVRLYERLVTRSITGEIHDLEHKRLSNIGKVDELDLVPDFWGRLRRIRRREAEITFQRIECCTALHRADRKRVRHEVDPSERGVGRLERQRRADWLRGECKHVTDRDILGQNVRD